MKPNIYDYTTFVVFVALNIISVFFVSYGCGMYFRECDLVEDFSAHERWVLYSFQWLPILMLIVGVIAIALSIKTKNRGALLICSILITFFTSVICVIIGLPFLSILWRLSS